MQPLPNGVPFNELAWYFPSSLRLARGLVVLAALSLCLCTSGCLGVKSYVDPKLRQVSYSDVRQTNSAGSVRVLLEFQRNGKPYPRAAKPTLQTVVRVLETSKVFSTVTTSSSEPAGEISIVMNNVGDLGDARAKGFGTGLTFGLAGSLVTDAYVFTATYRPIGKPQIQKVYEHALHSTVGNKSGPPGLTPMSLDQAYNQVVEQLVLNFVMDLLAEGAL